MCREVARLARRFFAYSFGARSMIRSGCGPAYDRTVPRGRWYSIEIPKRDKFAIPSDQSGGRPRDRTATPTGSQAVAAALPTGCSTSAEALSVSCSSAGGAEGTESAVWKV